MQMADAPPSIKILLFCICNVLIISDICFCEKFLDIKCRKANLRPDAVVLVATIKAIKYHGGIDKNNISIPYPQMDIHIKENKTK